MKISEPLPLISPFSTSSRIIFQLSRFFSIVSKILEHCGYKLFSILWL
ncbi:unnamed protein product [Schistosoma curassoni]|uniref:Uncharacterized protein n=1 Tax=Schistosoma curassoni TaxID=6186 RepID=A0A3P8CZB1_9TREM|nr:unnamed protein product [Schistosoma curassoni]